MQAQQIDHIARVTQAMADLPTLVVQYTSFEYGAGSYSAGRFSVGVRGESEWMEEPDFVDQSAVVTLINAYSGRVHYIANDDSTGDAEFWAKVELDQSPAPQAKQVLVATHPEAGVIGVFASQAAWEQHCAVTGATDLEEYATEWLVVEG
jgi:hypothetical protein